MAQVGWVFLDNAGKQHRIGLYHGDSSGHVLIHANYKIIQVDFSVKEAKTYTFFLEDELVEIRIHQEKEGFSYEFFIDKKTDTPLNRERKAMNKKYGRYVAYFVIGLFAVITFSILGIRWYGKTHREKIISENGIASGLNRESTRKLNEKGLETIGQIDLVRKDNTEILEIRFTTENGRLLQTALPQESVHHTRDGFHLASTNAFWVRYLPNDPYVFFMDFARPAASTIEQYFRQALAAEKQAHPQQSDGQTACRVQLILKEKGWQALADVIAQQEADAYGKQHSRNSYNRLVREPKLERMLEKECWDR